MMTQEEISLIDLWVMIKRQWLLIFVSTLIVVSFFLVLSLLMPKVYRAEVFLLPPEVSDVAQFKIEHIYDLPVDVLYGKFIRNLQSSELRHRFFIKNNLHEDLVRSQESDFDKFEIFQKRFNNLISVDVEFEKSGKPDKVTVTLDGVEPEIIANLLNEYVEFSNSYTIQSEIKSVNTILDIKVSRLNEEVLGLREKARKLRLDNIERLLEAAAIADKLGLIELNDNIFSSSPQLSASNKTVGVMVSSVEAPEYLRGSKALRVEAEALKKRKNDDPYIEKFRELQKEIFLLDQYKLGEVKARASRFDQLALSGDEPVKPKKKLFLAIGLILGVMTGVFVAILREVVTSNVKGVKSISR